MLLFQITLADVSGTGKDGRILKEDIMNYIEKVKSAPTAGKYAITMSSGLNYVDWIPCHTAFHLFFMNKIQNFIQNSNIWKSQHQEFQCLEKPKSRIPMFGNCQKLFRVPMFGKAKIKNSNDWKSQNSEFFFMFGKAKIENLSVWKSQNSEF